MREALRNSSQVKRKKAENAQKREIFRLFDSPNIISDDVSVKMHVASQNCGKEKHLTQLCVYRPKICYGERITSLTDLDRKGGAVKFLNEPVLESSV